MKITHYTVVIIYLRKCFLWPDYFVPWMDGHNNLTIHIDRGRAKLCITTPTSRHNMP